MAKMLPPCGGDTSWSSNSAAYNALSEPFRRFLDGLTAEHDFLACFTKELDADGDDKKWNEAVKNNPPVIHPVLCSPRPSRHGKERSLCQLCFHYSYHGAEQAGKRQAYGLAVPVRSFG